MSMFLPLIETSAFLHQPGMRKAMVASMASASGVMVSFTSPSHG